MAMKKAPKERLDDLEVALEATALVFEARLDELETRMIKAFAVLIASLKPEAMAEISAALSNLPRDPDYDADRKAALMDALRVEAARGRRERKAAKVVEA